jgi:hypothetical protein
MKQFFIKSLFFVLPFVIVAIIVEYKLRKIPNSYNYKKKSLKSKSNNLVTITLGASTALFGINPSYFKQPTFNLANASQSLYFDKELLLQQLDNLPKLKNVIIPIAYQSLYYKMNDSREKARVYAYNIFWNIKDQNFKPFDISNYSFIALLTPKSVFNIARKGFKKIDEDGIKLIDDFGFTAMDSTEQNVRINDSMGRERYLSHIALMKDENVKNNIEILIELLTNLNKKNINVYFVSTPLYKTYSRYLDNKTLSKNDSILNVLCKQFNCTYSNFSFDSRFLKEDFYDNDHLNKYGAIKFSTILDSLIDYKKL